MALGRMACDLEPSLPSIPGVHLSAAPGPPHWEGLSTDGQMGREKEEKEGEMGWQLGKMWRR